MADDGRFFKAQLVEGIFLRGLAGQLPARAGARLRTAGIDLSRPLRPTYPREVVLAALDVAAEELTPGAPREQAHRELGRRIVRGLLSTWRGKALAAAARSLGPERLLAKVGSRVPTPSNFLELELVHPRAGEVELRTNLGAPHPEVFQGILQALLEVVRAREARVEITQSGPEGERLRVTYAP